MSKDTITLQFKKFSHSFEIRHYYDCNLCYDEVKTYSEKFWESAIKNNAQENYEFDNQLNWSLGNMLKNNSFELGFTLLMKDNGFLAASGVRLHTETEAIALSRFFAEKSLLPYANAIMLPFQIEIIKTHKLKSAIITFNEYNQHLVKYYTEILPLKKDEVSMEAFRVLSQFEYKGKKMINQTEQTVFKILINN